MALAGALKSIMAWMNSYSTVMLVLGLLAVPVYVAFRLWLLFLSAVRSPLRKLPGPPSKSFVFGDLRETFELFKGNAGRKLDLWTEQYGMSFAYQSMLGSRHLCTADPVTVAYVCGNNYYDFPKIKQTSEDMALLLGKGLLFAEGDVHRRQRRILSHSFSNAQMRRLTEVFFDKAIELRDAWESQVETSGDQGAALDVCDWLSRATLDAVGQAGFGYYFGALQNEENDLTTSLIQLALGLETLTFTGSVLRSLFPFLRYLPSKLYRLCTKAANIVAEIGTELLIVEPEDVEPSSGSGSKSKSRHDLLAALVRANVDPEVKLSQRMSDEEVMGQISTFIIAGHETTSNGITWALYCLSRAPDIQAKLRDELLCVSNFRPSMEELSVLPYLDMVIREVLRLFPPIPMTTRVAAQDCFIPVSTPYVDIDGVTQDKIGLLAGDIIMISLRTMNRCTALWGPDSEEFRPERWEDDSPRPLLLAGAWGNIMTFLGGPRACIGVRFAIMEMKVLLFILLRSFVFNPVEPAVEITDKTTIVMRPVLKDQPAAHSQLPLFVKSSPN